MNKLGTMDILVAPYDENGTSLWAQRYGWTANNGVEWGRAIVADANNDLYVAGQYKTALQVTGLPELDACNNREQGFLMKLDANGNGLWSLRSQRDTSPMPPSVLVAELRDFLLAATGAPASRLVVEHPLQPFSPRYFSDAQRPDPRLLSYDQALCAPCKAREQPPA